MPNHPKLGHISPFFIVAELEPAVAFYSSGLGFEVRHKSPDDEPFFAIVGRDETQIYLKAIAPDIDPQPNPTRHRWARWDAFIYVEDPDSLASEYAGRNVAFHEDLGDTDDGLRGFEIKDHDGYVIFFGRPR